MIYDDLERELTDICMKRGIDLPEIDISKVRFCHVCQKPFLPKLNYQKYCSPKCAHTKDKLAAKEWYQNNKDHVRKLHKSYKKGKICTCCEIYPIKPGNRFLCALCFEHDGDDWKNIYYDTRKDKISGTKKTRNTQ